MVCLFVNNAGEVTAAVDKGQAMSLYLHLGVKAISTPVRHEAFRGDCSDSWPHKGFMGGAVTLGSGVRNGVGGTVRAGVGAGLTVR